MELVGRRGSVRNSVVAGSIWESRMKNDQVKGGIKVFNGVEEDNNTGSDQQIEGSSDSNGSSTKRQPLKRGGGITVGGVAISGKRKTWKSESLDGFDKSPIPIVKLRGEVQKNGVDQCKEVNVSVDGINKIRSPVQAGKYSRSDSVDGIKKSPIQVKKGRSEFGDGIERSPNRAKKERSESGEGNDKALVENRRTRSIAVKSSDDGLCNEIDESGTGIERNSVQLRKAKSVEGDGIEKNSIRLRKSKSEGLDDPVKSNGISLEEGNEETVKSPVELGSDENCDEIDVVISRDLNNAGTVKSPVELHVGDDNNGDSDEEMNNDDVGDEQEIDNDEDDEEEMEIEKPSIVLKSVKLAEDKVVNGVTKLNQFHNRASPFSSTVKQQPPPVIKRAATVYSNPTKPTPIPNRVPAKEQHQNFHQTHNKLQHLVDLIMWRDVSRSAFVFGLGSFSILSSSYTKDLNISFISVISYLGLVYLAAIFLYRSIIFRGVSCVDDVGHVLGEEEAIWLLKMVLPYLNEFLLKIRALFSGEPATTMKLAVLLFVLAKSGSSITIWKMAKLGFFGVFTVPKICSLYSTQLTAYAQFWIRRFRDAWNTCSHKKAVAIGVFTVVWNLSSVVARIWAAFMLFVALRYYKQSIVTDERVHNDVGETLWQEQEIKKQNRQEHVHTRIQAANKIKKAS